MSVEATNNHRSNRDADSGVLTVRAHACNSRLLQALGITHVLSVGENIFAEDDVELGHYKRAEDGTDDSSISV